MYLACDPGAIGFSLSFKECAETVAAAGYEGFWFNIGRDSAHSAAELGELLSRYKLKAAGFGLPVNLTGEEAVFKEGLGSLKKYGPFARELGLRRTTTWIRPGSDTLDYGAQRELYLRRLRETARALGGYDISLGLEFVGTPSFRRDLKHPFVYDLDGTLELIAAAGEPNLGLLLDLWHWDMAGHGPEDFKKLSSEKQVVLVHLNDAPRGLGREEQIDTSRCLPGETGVLKAAPFMAGLAALGYGGPAVVEPFYPALKKLPFPEAAKMVHDAARGIL